MSDTWWSRFGFWLETFPLGRAIVLRDDPHAGHLLVNRINGHVVVRSR